MFLPTLLTYLDQLRKPSHSEIFLPDRCFIIFYYLNTVMKCSLS